MGDISPETIIEVATGYMAAKQLLVAVEIGLFEQLAIGPATLDQLARHVKPFLDVDNAILTLPFIVVHHRLQRAEGERWSCKGDRLQPAGKLLARADVLDAMIASGIQTGFGDEWIKLGAAVEIESSVVRSPALLLPTSGLQ